ncbi:hypothetical protein ACFRAE_08505 [Sphingobacterium sp. HJSM2_6]|uniref:hypothetical protein n=1 Tax=Sphingobacterium sp. HJSM2_6 TaxID=3366264 RepID=UPI003BD92CD0
MEKQEYINLVLKAGKDALSIGFSNIINFNFIVQYQIPGTLNLECEQHTAFTIQGYKTWFVKIDGVPYEIGEFVDFWKPTI